MGVGRSCGSLQLALPQAMCNGKTGRSLTPSTSQLVAFPTWVTGATGSIVNSKEEQPLGFDRVYQGRLKKIILA